MRMVRCHHLLLSHDLLFPCCLRHAAAHICDATCACAHTAWLAPGLLHGDAFL
jgi:hypothetical protein